MEGTATKAKLLTMDQAAAYLGLQKSTLYEWISKKQIEHIRVGRLVKFHAGYLDRYIAQHTVKVRGAHGINQAA